LRRQLAERVSPKQAIPGTMVAWRTPTGSEYGVVIGSDGTDLLVGVAYDRSLKNERRVKLYRDEALSAKVGGVGVTGVVMDIHRVPAKKAYRQGRMTGQAIQPYVKMGLGLQKESTDMFEVATDKLSEIRNALTEGRTRYIVQTFMHRGTLLHTDQFADLKKAKAKADKYSKDPPSMSVAKIRITDVDTGKVVWGVDIRGSERKVVVGESVTDKLSEIRNALMEGKKRYVVQSSTGNGKPLKTYQYDDLKKAKSMADMVSKPANYRSAHGTTKVRITDTETGKVVWAAETTGNKRKMVNEAKGTKYRMWTGPGKPVMKRLAGDLEKVPGVSGVVQGTENIIFSYEGDTINDLMKHSATSTLLKKYLKTRRGMPGGARPIQAGYARRTPNLPQDMHVYKGQTERKARLGSGGRFKALKKTLQKRGVRDPAALAAYIGRKKYGKKAFQALGKAGRKESVEQGVLPLLSVIRERLGREA